MGPLARIPPMVSQSRQVAHETVLAMLRRDSALGFIFTCTRSGLKFSKVKVVLEWHLFEVAACTMTFSNHHSGIEDQVSPCCPAMCSEN